MSWGFVMGLKVDTQIIDKWLGTAMENYQKDTDLSCVYPDSEFFFSQRGMVFG